MTKVKSFEGKRIDDLELKIEDFINHKSRIKVISLTMSSVLYPYSLLEERHYAILIYE